MSVSNEAGVTFKWWERLAQYSYQIKIEQDQTEKCLPRRIAEVVIRFFSLMPHGVFYTFWERYRNYYNSLGSDGSQRVSESSEKEKSHLSIPIFPDRKVNAEEDKKEDLSIEEGVAENRIEKDLPPSVANSSNILLESDEEASPVSEISEKASTKKQEKANDLQPYLGFTKEEWELLRNNPLRPDEGFEKRGLTACHPPIKISAQLQNALNALFKTLANNIRIQPNSEKVLTQVTALYPLMTHDDDQKLIKEWVTCLYRASEFALGLNEVKRSIFVENLYLLYPYWKERTKDIFDMDKLLWIAFINVRLAWVAKPKRHPVHVKLGITLDEVMALEASGFAKRRQWESNLVGVGCGIGYSACAIGIADIVGLNVKIWETPLETEKVVKKGNIIVAKGQQSVHEMWELFNQEEKELLLQSIYNSQQRVNAANEALQLQGEDWGMNELFEAIRLLFGVKPH